MKFSRISTSSDVCPLVCLSKLKLAVGQIYVLLNGFLRFELPVDYWSMYRTYCMLV
jgi:hypothetical protein